MLTIYGIPEEVGRCYSCREAIKVCKENDLEYTFIPVMYADPESPTGFGFYRDEIKKLAIKLHKDNLRIVYPQIFENEKYIGSLLQFKKYIGDE